MTNTNAVQQTFRLQLAPMAKAPTPAALNGATGAANDDVTLLAEYIAALQNKLKGVDEKIEVPKNTLLGQWLTLYHAQLERPVVQEWMRQQHIDPATVSIVASTGVLHATVDGVARRFTLSDTPGWKAIAEPILAAARVITPTPDTPLHLSFENGVLKVPLAVVGDFYGQPRMDGDEVQVEREIQILIATKRLRPISAGDPLRPAATRSVLAIADQRLSAETFYAAKPQDGSATGTAVLTKTVKHLIADKADLYDLAVKLRYAATQGDGQPATAAQIAYSLNNERLVPFVGSTYAMAQGPAPTLAVALNDLGLALPRTMEELTALATTLEQQSQLSPLGNLGGALSWPIPMSQADQQKMLDFLYSAEPGAPGGALSPDSQATLGYLIRGSALTANDLQDPEKALQKLLDTPRAQALGKTLQTQMNGASSDSSIYDYLLTALNLGMDPKSYLSRERNVVGEFDLADPQHWGHSPSSVIESLGQHLVATQKATVDTAKLATHLLLGHTAPQFLIKDIPGNLTVGSQAWAFLSIAAATIEAERPGAVRHMTYAEVMLEYNASKGRSPATEYAQSTALVDWAVANGVIAKNADDTYTPAQLDSIKNSFNQQLEERLSASKMLYGAIPTRKEIALATLKERFGDLGPVFEKKVLGTDSYRGTEDQTGLVGRHSMLDIAMMDMPNPRPWRSDDPSIPLEQLNAAPIVGVQKAFDQQFTQAIWDKKTGTNATVRHMIAQLPLEDRQNFEFGKVTVFEESSHRLGMGFLPNNTEHQKEPGLIFRTELNGQSQAYEINLNESTIKQINLSRAHTKVSRVANQVHETKEITFNHHVHDLGTERGVLALPMDSFNSIRSNLIASAFVDHLELDDPSIKEDARGQTTLDALQGGPKPLDDFLLNLIPFRSAIVNFNSGNYGEAAQDLTMDIFGFLTAGAAVAGKLIKIGRSALSIGSKVLSGTRVIGAEAISLLNPLSGLNEMAAQGGKLLLKGGRYALNKSLEAVNKLKGATGSYDLLKAASKSQGITATGTYKFLEQRVDVGATLQNNKWYALDPLSQKPFGQPLLDFKPVTVAGNGEINHNFINWLSTWVAPTPRTPNLGEVFKKAIDDVKLKDIAGYNRGYANPRGQTIDGYYPTMNVLELKELAILPRRTPEETGALAKLIENLQTKNSLEYSRMFSEEIAKAGGKAIGMPQTFYLASNDITSSGECAALANTMALAIQHGKERVLIDNFFKASLNSIDPTITGFRRQLNSMHQALRVNFHGTNPVSRQAYTDIINDLSNRTTSTTLKISTQNHGLLAGVIVNNNQKEWFFFDPNFGLAKFPDEASMRRGLDATLNSGWSAGTLKPVAINHGIPEYDVSTFNDLDFLATVPYNNPYALFNTAL